MFFIPFWKFTLTDWPLKKEKLLMLANNSNMSEPKTERETTLTSYYTESNKHSPSIFLILKDEIESFCNLLEWSSVTFNGSWFQKSTLGQFIGPHTHGSLGFSATLYLEYDPVEHTPLVFIAPFHNFQNGEIIDYSPPEVKEGDLLIFPSQIMHYTMPSTSEKTRLVLSFNLLNKETHCT
jgi:hypothetical protein